MFTSMLKKHLKAAVSTAIILTLLGVVVAPLGYGRIALNTIDPVATVSDNGRRIVLTGPIQNRCGRADLSAVTVTQRTTGAVAEGDRDSARHGRAATLGSPGQDARQGAFEAGPATAVAIGVTSDHGQTTDAHHGCDITLVKE